MPLSFASRGGAGGLLTGAPPQGYTGAFGGIPQIPNPGATAGAALGANIGNLGSIYQLGGGLNQFQTGQAIGQVAQGLPDYANLVAQSSKNIGAGLKGQVAGDVLQQIMRAAAERGIITGTSGSPLNSAQYLAAVGQNSQMLQQQAEGNFTQSIARTPRPALFDYNQMLINPQQQQEAQMAANYMAAAPNPFLAGTYGLGAAQSGLRAGLGSISAPSMNRFAPQGQPFGHNPFGPQGYGGADLPMISYGGATGTPPLGAAGIAASWNDWAKSLPHGTAQYTPEWDPVTGTVKGEKASFYPTDFGEAYDTGDYFTDAG